MALRSLSLTSACVLPSTFFVITFPFASYPAVYRPSHRPSLRLRIFPSPLARRFGIVFTSFVFGQHTRLPQAQPNSKSNLPSRTFSFLTLLPILRIRICFCMVEKNYPIEVFILFSSRRTVGGRGVCVAQTCTDARSAHKTAHVGTTRPTPRSKWLRRCAFSDLCRSSAVSPPPAGGIGVRVLPASCVLVPKRDACAFLAQQEKPETQPESPVTVSYTA